MFAENYLDVQEDKKVREESLDYKRQRDEVVKTFESVQAKLVDLLEENLAERPLHQLSLSEFNLHHEAKKERLKMVRLDNYSSWCQMTSWASMAV